MPYVRGYVRRYPRRRGLFARRSPRRYSQSRRGRLSRETAVLALIALVLIILALATR